VIYKITKRLIDVTGATLLLLTLSPLLIIISLVIKIHDRGPIIFKQKRVGQFGKEFLFLKFRSMPVNTPNVVSTEVRKLNITPIGKIIRRTNLDEIPQMINVLKGDMSIIGPRPCLPDQESLIALRKANGSIKLKPGLTGWAQVNAYDYMPETEKADFDGEYCAKLSLWMDVEIVFRTLKYFIKKPPVY
jgi:O-antigen biosynthesis protein WbqP